MAALECEIVPHDPVVLSLSESLRPKQKLFIKYYLETGNGTESARRAGYAGDDNVLGVCAYDLLRNPKVRAELTRLLNPIADAEEVLARLTKYSRSSIADVLDGSGEFDLDFAKENHADDLIKKLKIRRRIIPVKDGENETEITHEIELHDAKDATIQLAKVHRLLTERIETETSINESDSERLADQLAQSLLAAISRKQLENKEIEG
jgi:phage terminase small subunit